ncbi:MAG: hypothetical protein ABIR59_04895 [Gemmatimonadales bacterium]
MSPMVRRVVAVVAALAAASAVVFVFEYLGSRFFPAVGVDLTDRAQIEDAVRTGSIPMGAMVMVAAGWVVAAVVGATVALRIGRVGGGGPTMIFAGLFTLVCAMNLIAFPHPAWMWFVGVVMVPSAAVLAGRDRSAS